MDKGVDFSPQAQRMVAALDARYAEQDRVEAQIALRDALRQAADQILSGTGQSLEAPAFFPPSRAIHPLRRYGWRWLNVRHYWIGFLAGTSSPTIMAIFYETSPGMGPLARSR